MANATGERTATEEYALYRELASENVLVVGDFSDKFSMAGMFLEGLMEQQGAVSFAAEASVVGSTALAGESCAKDAAVLADAGSWSSIVWVVAEWSDARLQLLEGVAADSALRVVDVSFTPDEDRVLRLESAGAEVHVVSAAEWTPPARVQDALDALTRRRMKRSTALVTSELLSRRNECALDRWRSVFGAEHPLDRITNPSPSQFVELIRRYDQLAMPISVEERPAGWQVLQWMAASSGAPLSYGLPAGDDVGAAGLPSRQPLTNRAEGTKQIEPPEASRRFVLLCGWFGADNLGDELILEQALEVIARDRPDLVPVVIGVDPPRTIRRHGVSSIARDQIEDIQFVMQRSLALVYCGGGVFQDYDFEEQGGMRGLVSGARGSILGYGAIARLARAAGVQVHFYGQGIGPLRSVDARRAFCEATSFAASVSVRDPESARVWKDVTGGVSPAVVEDPVYGAAADLSAVECAGGDGIAVNLRPWPFGDDALMRRALVDACDLAADKGTTIRGLPLSAEDSTYMNQLKAELTRSGYASVQDLEIVDVIGSVNEFANVMAGVGTAIGMRLHFCLLATALGVPTLGLAYDPKIRAFFTEMSMDSFVQLETAGPTELQDKLRHVTSAATVNDGWRAMSGTKGEDSRRQMAAFWTGIV